MPTVAVGEIRGSSFHCIGASMMKIYEMISQTLERQGKLSAIATETGDEWSEEEGLGCTMGNQLIQ